MGPARRQGGLPEGGGDRPPAGRQVALSLSDPFCVDRWRAEFADLIAQHVDILFGNEVEICSLYGTDELEQAVELVRGQVRLAALTRSAEGSVWSRGAGPSDPGGAGRAVIDSTGAGDLYAAGLLYGLTHDLPLAACGRLGSLAAADVLGQLGARPEQPLAPLVGQAQATCDRPRRAAPLAKRQAFSPTLVRGLAVGPAPVVALAAAGRLRCRRGVDLPCSVTQLAALRGSADSHASAGRPCWSWSGSCS